MNIKDRSAPPPPSFITTAENRRDEAGAINVERVNRNINESLRKQIIEIITKNPDFALSILRGWKDRER